AARIVIKTGAAFDQSNRPSFKRGPRRKIERRSTGSRGEAGQTEIQRRAARKRYGSTTRGQRRCRYWDGASLQRHSAAYERCRFQFRYKDDPAAGDGRDDG